MRFRVEASPSGGYRVTEEGGTRPVALFDTEEEAQAARLRYANGAAERVRLRDGAEILVRPMDPEDAPLLAQGFELLGAESRYRRFMAYKKRLSAVELERLSAVDHRDHEAYGALDAATRQGVAIARMHREPGRPDTAEAAVTVIDAWQGRGVGSVLLERLAARALEQGITRYTALVLADNPAMLRLFGRVGRVRVTAHHGDSLEVEVDLAPVAAAAPREETWSS